MFEQLYGTSKNMEGDDNDKILKESLTRELEKEMQRPDPEIDWEHVQAILKVLRPLESREERTSSDSPDKKEPTPEERTAAFIDRFNKRNGTNSAVSEEETKIRKLNTRKKLVRAAVLVGVVFGSFVTMNQVTMASANQSIFEFLGMKAAKLVYEINGKNDSSGTAFTSQEDQNTEWSNIQEQYAGKLYLPQDIPGDMKIGEMREYEAEGMSQVFIAYESADLTRYLQITVYQAGDIQGRLDIFIGDEWIEKNTQLDNGETLNYYVGEESIKSILYKSDLLYTLDSNISEEEFLQVIDSMEVIGETD